MPVSVPLNQDAMEVYRTALKKAKMDTPNNGTFATVTSDDFSDIMNAVEAYKNKKVAVKNKNVEHLSIIFECEQILKRLSDVGNDHGFIREVANDNADEDNNEDIDEDTEEFTDDVIDGEVTIEDEEPTDGAD